jgi:hypothetical protein
MLSYMLSLYCRCLGPTCHLLSGRFIYGLNFRHRTSRLYFPQNCRLTFDGLRAVSIVVWANVLLPGKSRYRIPIMPLDILKYLIISAETWPWNLLIIKEKWLPGIFFEVKCGRRLRLTNLTVICEPIVKKMWRAVRLAIVWVFAAC